MRKHLTLHVQHWGTSGEVGRAVADVLKQNSSLRSFSLKADSSNLQDKTGKLLAEALPQNSSLASVLSKLASECQRIKRIWASNEESSPPSALFCFKYTPKQFWVSGVQKKTAWNLIRSTFELSKYSCRWWNWDCNGRGLVAQWHLATLFMGSWWDRHQRCEWQDVGSGSVSWPRYGKAWSNDLSKARDWESTEPE